MAKGLCPPFDAQAYREGHLTPVFFGSALNNFGVRELLHGVGELAPAPRPQPAAPRRISPGEPAVAGFVFKVQANIDPQHRDRIAFVRLASGRFQRGMKLKNIRTGRQCRYRPRCFSSPASATSPRRPGPAKHHRHPQPRASQPRGRVSIRLTTRSRQLTISGRKVNPFANALGSENTMEASDQSYCSMFATATASDQDNNL
jgi:hypothetical protein